MAPLLGSEVAFLMNCGGAGAGTADALAEAYPVAPGSHVEQQGSYARAPLSYQGDLEVKPDRMEPWR